LPDKQTEPFDLVILVAIRKVESLSLTLSTTPTNINIHVVCRGRDIKKVSALTSTYTEHNIKIYPSPVAQLDTENSVFFIHAGQVIDKQLGKAIFHWSNGHDILYTDKDFIIEGKHQNPIFLPDWNPDLQLSAAYIRTGLWFKHQDDIPAIISHHAQTIAEWAAFLYLNISHLKIARIPYSLVHDSESRKFNYNSYANSLSMFPGHRAKISVNAFIGKLTWRWRHHNQLVSIIIPVAKHSPQLDDCVRSIMRSAYLKIEVLVVTESSIDDNWLLQIEGRTEQRKVRIVEYNGSFHYASMISHGVKFANGEIIGMISPNVEAVDAKWLNHIVSNVSRTDIGCVGAKLFSSDGRIKHAGIILGNNKQTGYAHKYFPGHHLGYLKRLVVNQNYSALDGACLFVKKHDFVAAHGLNSQELINHYADIDFCLRMISMGKRNMFCAKAKLYHHDTEITGATSLDVNAFAHQSNEPSGDYSIISKDRETLYSLWPEMFKDDPAYNPNLSLEGENFAPRTANELKQMKLLPNFHLQRKLN